MVDEGEAGGAKGEELTVVGQGRKGRGEDHMVSFELSPLRS